MRSDGRGGRVTLSEPAILVYGGDYKGGAVTPGKVRAPAAELQAPTFHLRHDDEHVRSAAEMRAFA